MAEIYRLLDGLIGEVCRRAGREGAAVLLMSDHGFGPTEGYFNANRLLEEVGLLRVKREVAARKRMFYRVWKAGDSRAVQALVPKGLQRALRSRIRRGRSSFLSDVIPFLDMEGTTAFYASIPCHGVFIRTSGEGAVAADKGRYRQVREKIKRALSEARHPDGKPFLTGLWDREELYSGPMTPQAPDVVFAMRDFGVIPRPLLGATDLYRPMNRLPNGFHRMDGIVALWGEGIDERKIEGAQMIDIAPTLIARLGLPVPPVMEGKALI